MGKKDDKRWCPGRTVPFLLVGTEYLGFNLVRFWAVHFGGLLPSALTSLDKNSGAHGFNLLEKLFGKTNPFIVLMSDILTLF